ncbi:MAG: TetR family transcriptional regulator [Solirubrobacterales bacterium]
MAEQETETENTTTPYAVAARELLRDTLLDAGGQLLGEQPWPTVTMADVARAAGVSRQTLYKEFGSRLEFEQALVLREADGFLDAVEEPIASHHDEPAVALASAFDAFLGAAAAHPIVRELLTGQRTEDLLPVITTHQEALLTHAVDRLGAMIDAGWPGVDAGDARLLAETAGRLAVSYVALPSSPSGLTADGIATLLGPWIENNLVPRPAGGPAG